VPWAGGHDLAEAVGLVPQHEGTARFGHAVCGRAVVRVLGDEGLLLGVAHRVAEHRQRLAQHVVGDAIGTATGDGAVRRRQ